MPLEFGLKDFIDIYLVALKDFIDIFLVAVEQHQCDKEDVDKVFPCH